ncbi:class I adenylate-forming enzyme family protein [Schaalia sp. lx-260]|uniref:class I adenylate-forming enzyme family protein n=1 Tax=Schaalia sp. lx-260 TaxID=2899082 RepID=UPI001E289433|nr:class I adenylate-forming enzyme family protein [Schaalia sp. lx-260]MCD4549339.1 acyl--CoA ligase [Schaalia sp. lx-260]
MPLMPDYAPARPLFHAALQHPHRISLIEACSGRTWTVSQAWESVCRMSAVFLSHGVKASDRVAIVAVNNPRHFIAHVALSLLGAVTVPLSPRLPDAQLEVLFTDCRPHLVITDGQSQSRACFSAWPTVTWDELDQALSGVQPWAGTITPRDHEIAAIVYTSGSTGLPRPISLTHAHLWWASVNFRDGFEYSPGINVVGVCAPLSHIGGFNGTSMDVFTHGGTVVVFDSFNPVFILRAIERYEISMMFAVPAMCHAFLSAREEAAADISSWTRPLIGGERMSTHLAKRLHEWGLRPIHVWGMTETGGAGLMCSPDAQSAHPGAIGRPFPYVEERVVDDEGSPIHSPHVLGHLHVRGPGVVTSRADGWLDTGDMVHYDEGGFIHFVSRLSRLINTGGELVAPGVVEDAVRTLDSVADVLVLGIPNERWGQVVAALVVPDPAYASNMQGLPSLQQIQQFTRDFLAPWQQPRLIRWVESLPTTSTGKPDPHAARAYFDSAQ